MKELLGMEFIDTPMELFIKGNGLKTVNAGLGLSYGETALTSMVSTIKAKSKDSESIIGLINPDTKETGMKTACMDLYLLKK